MGYGFPSSFFRLQGPGFKVVAVTVLTALGTAAVVPLPAESGMSNQTPNTQPSGQAADVSPFCQTLVSQFSPFGNSDQAILSAAFDQGGDLNQPCLLYGERWLPLNYLLSTDDALAQRLIDQGVDVNAQDGEGNTPLHYVGASPALAQALLFQGANVNARNQNGLTPLHNVFGKKNVAVMALLIEAGAEVNAQDNEQLTPLHLVCNAGSPEIADLLIRHGAEVNARSNQNYTPLHYAAWSNSGVAERLLQAGADLTLQNDAGAVIHTPSLDPVVLKLLLDYGADVNLANAAGQTPLHVHRFNPALTGQLLAAGADVNRQDSQGRTALFDVNLEVAQQLLSAGANLMVQDHQGRTALHQAVLEEQSFFGPELVALFLSQAQPRIGLVQIRDHQGETALELAQRLGKTELVNLLQTVSDESRSDGAKTIAPCQRRLQT
jgi:ankyrin repeat protein